MWRRPSLTRACSAAGRSNCLAEHRSACGGRRVQLYDTFVANLRFAADALAAEGIKLLMEPINTRDIPGFYLEPHARQALELIEAGRIGQSFPAVRYLPHADHGGRSRPHPRGEPAADRPCASWPTTQGRHEPGSGEIHYPFLFDHLDRIGYAGWIGCEYKPARTTLEGLGWANPMRPVCGRAAPGNRRSGNGQHQEDG